MATNYGDMAIGYKLVDFDGKVIAKTHDYSHAIMMSKLTPCAVFGIYSEEEYQEVE